MSYDCRKCVFKLNYILVYYVVCINPINHKQGSPKELELINLYKRVLLTGSIEPYYEFFSSTKFYYTMRREYAMNKQGCRGGYTVVYPVYPLEFLKKLRISSLSQVKRYIYSMYCLCFSRL